MTLSGYFISKSVFDQQGYRALSFALARLSCSHLTTKNYFARYRLTACWLLSANILHGEKSYFMLQAYILEWLFCPGDDSVSTYRGWRRSTDTYHWRSTFVYCRHHHRLWQYVYILFNAKVKLTLLSGSVYGSSNSCDNWQYSLNILWTDADYRG